MRGYYSHNSSHNSCYMTTIVSHTTQLQYASKKSCQYRLPFVRLMLIVCLFPFRFQRHSVVPFYRSVLPFYRFTVRLRVPASATEGAETAGECLEVHSVSVARQFWRLGGVRRPSLFERGLFAAAHYGQQASGWSGRGYGCGSTTRVHSPSRASV